MASSKFWIPFTLGLLITPLLFGLGMSSVGAGHGDYLFAKILFPFTLLIAGPLDSVAAFILISAAQFPLYGLVLGVANVRGKFFVAALVLMAVHGIAVATCFYLMSL